MSGDKEFDVIIAGCGLSGLTAAFELLKGKAGLRVCIVEARKRMGGRLKTVFTREGKGVDMGGSWVCFLFQFYYIAFTTLAEFKHCVYFHVTVQWFI